jgi:hypothetical protein
MLLAGPEAGFAPVRGWPGLCPGRWPGRRGATRGFVGFFLIGRRGFVLLLLGAPFGLPPGGGGALMLLTSSALRSAGGVRQTRFAGLELGACSQEQQRERRLSQTAANRHASAM